MNIFVFDYNNRFGMSQVKNKLHQYKASLHWTGNKGTGTDGYTKYERSHTINITGKPELLLSSDPSFRGNRSCYNPEELLVCSISSCHMLWYLHLCMDAGVVVIGYQDQAEGTMEEAADGSGRFTEITLYPKVTVASAEMVEKANALHKQAHKMCFIANSVNFPIHHKAHAEVMA